MKRSIAIASLVLALSGSAIAGEKNTLEQVKDNVNINEPNNKVTLWIKNTWEDTKAYNRKGWADGKAQLARNKEQIKNLPQTFSAGVKKLGNDVSGFAQKIVGKGNKDVGTDKN